MEGSLYERLGRIESIGAVVEDFRDRVARDDRIKQKFARTDLGRLTRMLIDQVCQAAGGPCTYTGRSMKDAHAGMGVTSGEFDALVGDLVATLTQFRIGKTATSTSPEDDHRGAGVTHVVRRDRPPGRDHIRPMKRSARGRRRTWTGSSGGGCFGT